MTEQLYRFVKYDPANPPKFDDSDIPDWKFAHLDLCKVDDKPIGPGWFTKDISEEKVWFTYYPFQGSHFTDQIQEKDFSRVQYLSPVSIEPESGVRKALDEIWRITNALRPFREGIIKEVNEIASKALSSLEPVEDNQDAIAFMDFANTNRYVWDHGKHKFVATWDNYSEYTTTELYNLYKQSK